MSCSSVFPPETHELNIHMDELLNVLNKVHPFLEKLRASAINGAKETFVKFRNVLFFLYIRQVSDGIYIVLFSLYHHPNLVVSYLRAVPSVENIHGKMGALYDSMTELSADIKVGDIKMDTPERLVFYSDYLQGN